MYVDVYEYVYVYGRSSKSADVIRRLRFLLKKGELEYVSLDVNDLVTEVARDADDLVAVGLCHEHQA